MEIIGERAKALPSSFLDRKFMRRLRAWFREDLSAVKLLTFCPGVCLEPIQTPLAFAEAEKIYILDAVASSDRERIEFILCHEFAHVIQKRLGQRLLGRGEARRINAADLEHEAETTALAFQAGAARPQLSPDPLPVPRAWGPAGHFYTVYWVSRIAGAEDSTAERLAFYAQMPDQVSNLDAKLAGIAWAKSAFWPSGPIRERMVGGENRFDSATYQIQAGLHCLNHREGKAESKRREAILRKLPADNFLEFSFGLGLHALGDSFAHRNDDGMTFIAPFGHAGAGKSFDERIVKLGTEIDNLSKHSDRYNEYCLRMYHTVGDCFGNKTAEERRSVLPEVGHNITKILEKTDELQQIQVIKRFYTDRRGSYQPEKLEPMPWADFRLRYPSFTAGWMPEKAQALAEAWTVSPG
jgi:hypothetical protein